MTTIHFFSSNRHRKGFTLIELIVTVAIIGILAAMAVPMGEVVIRRNKEHELRSALREIRSAIDAYKLSYDQGHMLKTVGASGYPPTLQVLEEGVSDAKSATSKKIFFLRKVPSDPFSKADSKGYESWGLRCYNSSASEPTAGADVFDVYSLNPAVGLNGIPYKEW